GRLVRGRVRDGAAGRSCARIDWWSAAVAARRAAVGRVRLQPDPYAGEPFGVRCGEPLTVLADDGLPLYVEIDEPAVRRPGLPTLVFCHGYCLTQDTWHFQRRDLAEFRRVFWDQRSHGASGRSKPANATIDQTGADLAAVLRATVRPDEPVVLVGHSMGGMSIMALADREPELFGSRVLGVGLVNTSTGDVHEMTLGFPLVLAKLVRPFAPRVVQGLGRRKQIVDPAREVGADLAFFVIRRMGFADRRISPAIVDFVEQMIRVTPIDVIAEFYPSLMRHDKRAALEVLTKVPVLVMSGGADLLTPRAHGELIAELLDDAEFVGVEAAGHLLPLEHPDTVTAALRRLVERAAGGGRNGNGGRGRRKD
ncbi:alpha/beta hydrolase, partial [Actinocorallia libanotica]|uniref:alpha/beta fold hydrolase n=1 Tax=Actinocorallia libanotica TaxID=46162 RepID=UPI0031D3082A